jgi:hypothetical protein
LARRPTRGGPRDGDESDRDGGEPEREYREHERDRGPWDDPGEHHKIEKRRFEGGLPATPELYARAREQWYRLPGAVVRPSMNPGVGNPPSGEPHSPGKADPGGNGREQ